MEYEKDLSIEVVAFDQLFASELPKILRLLRQNKFSWVFSRKHGKNRRLSFEETSSSVANSF